MHSKKKGLKGTPCQSFPDHLLSFRPFRMRHENALCEARTCRTLKRFKLEFNLDAESDDVMSDIRFMFHQIYTQIAAKFLMQKFGRLQK